jgi:hypothetical protein
VPITRPAFIPDDRPSTGKGEGGEAEVTFGREQERSYTSVDVEPLRGHVESDPLVHDQRERRGNEFKAETGAPANRTQQESQPYHQRVRTDDWERLGFADLG